MTTDNWIRIHNIGLEKNRNNWNKVYAVTKYFQPQEDKNIGKKYRKEERNTEVTRKEGKNEWMKGMNLQKLNKKGIQ